MTDVYDPADNSRKCHDFAILVWREICIRKQHVLPRPDDEREKRWAETGWPPHWGESTSYLDTVREGG